MGASPGGPSPREVESKGTPPPAPPAQTASERIANRWEADGILYASPAGANDDWFWLYAATVLGDGWHVVTNDQMKDHHWQMLGPRSFLQVRASAWQGEGVCVGVGGALGVAPSPSCD